MFSRLILLFSLILSFETTAQDLKPPLGLEFGMSKQLFVARMFPRYKPSKPGKQYSDSDSLVVFSDIRFGSGIASELSAYFFRNKLYKVRVHVSDLQKDEMYETYVGKYGKPIEYFGTAWKTKEQNYIFQ